MKRLLWCLMFGVLLNAYVINASDAPIISEPVVKTESVGVLKTPLPPKQVEPQGLHRILGKKAEVIINNLAKKGYQGKITKEKIKDAVSFTGITGLKVHKETVHYFSPRTKTEDKSYEIRKPKRWHVGFLNGERASVIANDLSGTGELERGFKYDTTWVKDSNGNFICTNIKKVKCIRGKRIQTILPHERFDRFHQRADFGLVIGGAISGVF
jgi:hypothetical protein